MKYSARLDRCPVCGAKGKVLLSVDSSKHVPTPGTYAWVKCLNTDCPCRQCPIKCRLGYEGWGWDRRSQKTWTRQEILNRVTGSYISKECPRLNLG